MEDDKLKGIIKQIGLPDPGASFAGDILKALEADADLSISSAFRSALKPVLIAEPPAGFTNRLMSSLTHQSRTRPAPVITKKVWLIVSGMAASIVLTAVFASLLSADHLPANSQFSTLGSALVQAAAAIAGFAPSVFTYLIPVSLLLTADYLFRNRRLRTNAFSQSS